LIVFPLTEAVSVVIPTAPVKLIFSVPVAALVRPPLPARVVDTVNELLLVSVTPVTVTLGIVNVPISACELILKVCTPVLAVNVPLLVIPLLNVGVTAALSVQLELVLIVTSPVKVLAGFVAEENDNIPADPPLPTVVVPVTLKVKAPTVKVVPFPMIRLPPTVKAAPVVAAAAPLKVRLPVMDVVAPNVLAPLPESVRLT